MTSEYQKRDKILTTLGFSSYTVYQQSPLWQKIRGKVLRKNQYCALCGDIANTVHHLKYTPENLIGKNIKGLCSLCKGCHCKVELAPGGRKLPFKYSLKKFFRLLLKYKKKCETYGRRDTKRKHK